MKASRCNVKYGNAQLLLTAPSIITFVGFKQLTPLALTAVFFFDPSQIDFSFSDQNKSPKSQKLPDEKEKQ